MVRFSGRTGDALHVPLPSPLARWRGYRGSYAEYVTRSSGRRSAAHPIIRSVHRFYAPALDPGDETVALLRDEAEHLTRVLRLGVGDTVAVFDGRGHEFVARVASALRRDVRVQIVSRLEPAAESGVALTLAQAILKGDKMDDVIRDAVMLGAFAVQPIVTRRSETTVAALMKGARLDRWR